MVMLGFKTCVKSLSIAFFILSMHYVAIQVYTNVCVPFGVKGYILSLFTVASPPCSFLLKVAITLQYLYITVWFSIGVALISFIGGIWNTIVQVKQ